jgi:hypothetical protein
MSGLKGNVNDLRKLQKRITNFPISCAHNVAQESSPKLTQFALSAFNSGNTVYGEARPKGVNGNTLDLVRDKDGGTTRSTIRFVAIGTIVRCALGTDYAKYLIGKYKILPMGPMPVKWAQEFARIVSEQKF